MNKSKKYGVSSGIGSLAWLVIGFKTGWSYAMKEEDLEQFVGVRSDRIEVLPN